MTIGAFLTALLQSSSVIALITLGFVEAGLIPFKNAFALIMGSNLGSTMVSWIIATFGFKMDIEGLALPGLAISSIAMFVLKPRRNLFNLARLVFAISMLFYGLAYMKESADASVKQFNLAAYADSALIFFVLVGFIITSIVQTSSATMAITLTALYASAISLPSAAAVVIGSETGTSLKTFIAGFGAGAEKKRAAYGNFFFNLATTVLAFIFLHQILWIISGVFGIKDSLISLAMFQTLINLIAIMLFLPLINPISRLLERKIPDGDHNASFVRAPLEEADTSQLRDEVMHMLERDLEFHDMVLDLEKPEAEGLLENFKSFAKKSGNTSTFYNRLKATEGDLLSHYMRIRDELKDATDTESLMECLRQILHSAKSIKDVHHNIAELRESGQDSLHVHYHRLQKNWQTFREQFSEQYHSGTGTYDSLMHQAYREMEEHNKAIMQQLHEGVLREIEASTLMNIERELLSSKKSLIRAAERLA